jgi:tetratricopeptide (TPR) repeat protein
MKKFKIFCMALMATAGIVQAQDVDQAKKAIDAEQYEKAKAMLKSMIQAKPQDGKAPFLLGTIYLKQNIEDSAKIAFNKGIAANDGARFNSIGLGQIDLENGNAAAAKTKFDLVIKDLKKKDIEEYVYIAKAYMNAEKPNYKAAIEVLNKAKLANPNTADVQLALGDAFYGDKNQNEAYAAYRSAYTLDSSLIRAKMQLGVLLKGAKAYTEAVKAYDEVIKINPSYGPVFRELAETYYLWGNNEPRKYNENISKALGYYEKYMGMTDYSLTSRMRHADFLILAKDYKALEVEAEQMKKLDKVNPRILRYLGYAAYENGNTEGAISALNDFITKGTNKLIARDYLYLGLAKLKKATAIATSVDQTLLTAAILDIKKAVELEPTMVNDLNEVGKNYFTQKMYGVAGTIFGIAITNSNSKNYLEDNVYYGLCVYTDNKSKDAALRDKVALGNADVAMDNVLIANPTYQEGLLYKARINNLLDQDEIMAVNYQKYVDMVLSKGEEEAAKSKKKITESYNAIAAHYANSDKAKAKEYFNKTLAIDPADSYALESLKILK